jgi:hypothetical protein
MPEEKRLIEAGKEQAPGPEAEAGAAYPERYRAWKQFVRNSPS